MTTAYTPGRFNSERFDQLCKLPRPDGGKWTANGIAAALGELGEDTTHQTIQQLRAGTRTNPRLSLVIRLAELFDVPIGWLVNDRSSERVARLLDPDRVLENSVVWRLVDVAQLLDHDTVNKIITDAAVRVANTLPSGFEATDAARALPADVITALRQRRSISQ